MYAIARIFAFLALAVLAACGPPASNAVVTTLPDGTPGPSVYQIRASDKDDIQLRMLDSVNALRQAANVPAVTMNAKLNAAAATHSRDMSVQNRPWHFGSDGSSPIDRVVRAGFDGQLVGENISETYETETQTLAAWMEDPATRTVILDPRARSLGFEWYQEDNGKLWWTLILGT
ncbi:MAG: CAP domain-containing protein [Pseudomonadota bacterium]